MPLLIALRFFCPALVSPVQHGVTDSSVSKKAQRGLILVSKIIQQLSNAQNFGGGKEEHMVSFNNYITENIPIVQTYLTKLTVCYCIMHHNYVTLANSIYADCAVHV